MLSCLAFLVVVWPGHSLSAEVKSDSFPLPLLPRAGLPPEARGHRLDEYLHRLEIGRRQTATPSALFPLSRPDYDNPLPTPVDILSQDTVVGIDRDVPDYLTVETIIRLQATSEGVAQLSFQNNVSESVHVSASVPLAQFKQSGTSLNVSFSEPLAVGTAVELVVSTTGPIQKVGDPMLDTARLSGTIWYVTHSQFMPTRSTSDDLFTGTMTLVVSGKGAESLLAGGTGTLEDMKWDQEAGVSTFRFRHHFHTSLYAFSLGPFRRIESPDPSGVPLAVFVMAEQEASAPLVLGIMSEVLDLYGSLFVPYPWGKLDAVTMPNSFSGGFGPLSTVMMMQNTFKVDAEGTGRWGAMQLISHEVAHQWWGNLVEMADYGSIFLSEGLAEFSSNLYVEKVADNRWSFASNNMTYVFTVDHSVAPQIVSPFIYNSPYYYQVAYQKGACVADVLRTELGEETFLTGIRLFLERFQRKFATARDLFDVLEEYTGQSLQWFWDQWMAGRSVPLLHVGAWFDISTSTLRFMVRQNDLFPFRLTLPIVLRWEDGERQEIRVSVAARETVVDIPVSRAPQRVQVDPRFHTIRRLRPLLQGDLDLNGVVDGRDLVEMSFAYQVNIVQPYRGREYFIPNTSYRDLADLVKTDGTVGTDGKITEGDVQELLSRFGTVYEFSGDGQRTDPSLQPGG
jgi:hypothetical protein